MYMLLQVNVANNVKKLMSPAHQINAWPNTATSRRDPNVLIKLLLLHWRWSHTCSPPVGKVGQVVGDVSPSWDPLVAALQTKQAVDEGLLHHLSGGNNSSQVAGVDDFFLRSSVPEQISYRPGEVVGI